MKKYIICQHPNPDEVDRGENALALDQLAIRKTFNSFHEAFEHTKCWAPGNRERVFIVECPRGVDFEPHEKEK